MTTYNFPSDPADRVPQAKTCRWCKWCMRPKGYITQDRINELLCFYSAPANSQRPIIAFDDFCASFYPREKDEYNEKRRDLFILEELCKIGEYITTYDASGCGDQWREIMDKYDYAQTDQGGNRADYWLPLKKITDMGYKLKINENNNSRK